MKIFHQESLSSTNSVLKAWVEGRADSLGASAVGAAVASAVADVAPMDLDFPVALTADEQTAGRGVGKNVWCSEKGANALFSMAFKPTFLLAEHQFLLNLALSLSLLETLEDFVAGGDVARDMALRDTARDVAFGRDVALSPFSLKWPNDLYIGEKKVGGILFEVSVLGERCAMAIMGVGVNVNQRKFPKKLPNPISLCEVKESGTTGAENINMPALRQRLIEKVAQAYCQLEERAQSEPMVDLLKDYKAAYQKRLLFLGLMREYIYQEKRVRAVLQGVDDYGQAVLQTEDGGRITCGLKELKYVFES